MDIVLVYLQLKDLVKSLKTAERAKIWKMDPRSNESVLDFQKLSKINPINFQRKETNYC